MHRASDCRRRRSSAVRIDWCVTPGAPAVTRSTPTRKSPPGTNLTEWMEEMRKPMLWMCLVLLVCAAAAVADPVPYEITGEVRVRNENDDRDFNSATGYKSFNYMRTRLGIDVKPADAMNVFVQVQDSRVQGLAETSTGRSIAVGAGTAIVLRTRADRSHA